MLLVPGVGLTGRVYEPVADRLRPDHEVVSLDRPGLGLAARLPLRVPDLDEWVRQIDVTLDLADAAAGVAAPALLVGHSMAGLAAEAYARVTPARVSALVLLDGSVAERAAKRRGRAVGRAGTGPRGADVRWAATRERASHPFGRVGVAVAEARAYQAMGEDLLRVRAARPLTVPTVVLAAAWTGWAPWDRRWLAAQQDLVRDLRASHAERADGARHERSRAGHLVMRWAPEQVAAVVRELTRRPAGGTAG